MFAPAKPMMREYCERDEHGTAPVLDEEDGEEVCYWKKEGHGAFCRITFKI